MAGKATHRALAFGAAWAGRRAHCISDWGHDFRPDYRRIVRVLRFLPPGVPVLCTTATANDRVVGDVEAQNAGLSTLRGPLVRQSLRLFNIRLDDQAERLGWLAQFLPKLPGSGIVYCLTIQDTRRVAAWLQHRGLAVEAYHADLQGEQRVEIEKRLLDNRVKAVVATVALGMGFDKPDLGFVVHFQRPGSVVAYYQQVGRAGRAVDNAFGILLSGREDDEIADYFIRTAFPPLAVMQGTLSALDRSDGLTLDQLGAELNHGRGALEKALKLLEVDGAVRRDKSRWCRAPNPWTPEVERWAAVTRHRRQDLSRTIVLEAIEFLRADDLVLQPRTRWPRAVLGEIREVLPRAVEDGRGGNPKTTFPEDFRPCEGRALCLYGDAGWGPAVARGKYETGVLADDLVAASARLVAEKWKPDPAPAWVCCVPSLDRPALVSAFAERLAGRLGLSFVPVLRRIRASAPQKAMENSVQQVRNLLGAFSVAHDVGVPPGPVLLVDDVVDSGWTITLLAIMLRERGSGPVHPFALAKATPRGG